MPAPRGRPVATRVIPASCRRLLALLVSLAATAPAVAQTRMPVPPALLARAAAGESVDVIVGVAAPAAPDGPLATAAREAQRLAAARAVDDVRTRAEAAGVLVGAPIEGLPYFRATLPAGTLDTFARLPGVVSVEEVVAYRPALLQSTTLVNAPPAWSAGTTGAGWTVAVLDSGVQSSHPFLGGRVVSQACFSTLSGASSLCPGGAASSIAPASAEPCAGIAECDHGTHVAGIATGTGGPAGLQGLAPGANVNTSQAACDAANPSLKTAIDQLRALGIATVISAGNQGYGDALAAPACLSSAVSVGATTDTAPAVVPGYSNDAPFLTLLAPGSNITSAVPGGGYAVRQGTSMAAPHVAGAWAVLKQAAPAATVSAVLASLTTTGTPVRDAGTGRTHPLINVDGARRMLIGAGGPPQPGAPTNFDADVTGNTVTFTWTAPVVGAPATGYALVARATPGGPITGAVPVGNVTSYTTRAADGVYVVTVVALNASGPGAESNALTLTLPGGLGRPDGPTNLRLTLNGSAATFRWTPPVTGGPVEQYVFIAGGVPGFSTPAATIDLPPTETTLVIPNVPPGTYYARVFARNRFGPSAFSSNEVVVPIAGTAPPTAPLLNTPVVQGSTVRLSWAPGSGNAPTSYLLIAAFVPGGAPAASAGIDGTTAAFTGVLPGTYYLRLYGVNVNGVSPPSNEMVLFVP